VAGHRLTVGLTGGIASGKTTVSDLFADLGVTIIDTDVIAREVVEPDTPGLAEIREAFGAVAIDSQGGLDRAALRKIVFADDAARARLEAILHPRIREEALRQAGKARGDYVIIVVPLLVESPLRNEVDRILVVDCAEETQIERLLSRDAETGEQARRMLAAQASRSERLAAADDVIHNDGDLEETQRQVEALHAQYQQLARQ